MSKHFVGWNEITDSCEMAKFSSSVNPGQLSPHFRFDVSLAYKAKSKYRDKRLSWKRGSFVGKQNKNIYLLIIFEKQAKATRTITSETFLTIF